MVEHPSLWRSRTFPVPIPVPPRADQLSGRREDAVLEILNAAYHPDVYDAAVERLIIVESEPEVACGLKSSFSAPAIVWQKVSKEDTKQLPSEPLLLEEELTHPTDYRTALLAPAQSEEQLSLTAPLPTPLADTSQLASAGSCGSLLPAKSFNFQTVAKSQSLPCRSSKRLSGACIPIGNVAARVKDIEAPLNLQEGTMSSPSSVSKKTESVPGSDTGDGTSAGSELSTMIDSLLNELTNKFTAVANELTAKMDDMGRRIDNLEASLQAQQHERGSGTESGTDGNTTA